MLNLNFDVDKRFWEVNRIASQLLYDNYQATINESCHALIILLQDHLRYYSMQYTAGKYYADQVAKLLLNEFTQYDDRYGVESVRGVIGEFMVAFQLCKEFNDVKMCATYHEQVTLGLDIIADDVKVQVKTCSNTFQKKYFLEKFECAISKTTCDRLYYVCIETGEMTWMALDRVDAIRDAINTLYPSDKSAIEFAQLKDIIAIHT